MADTKRWKKLSDTEDHLVTKIGAAFVGKRVVFRGHDLHRDLADFSWMDLHLFGITGRRFSSPELKLLNTIWTFTSYPDPRLWNNRIAALAGSVRSSGSLGVSAALSVSEAKIYGQNPNIRSICFLQHAKRQVDSGQALKTVIESELERHRGIAGFGRPLARIDERIPPLLNTARRLSLADGAYVKLAFELETYLLEHRWRLRMNAAALAAALSADLGFSPREYYLYMIPAFLAGMLPCYIDALEKPAGTFFPLRCTRLAYAGEPRRSWNEDD